MILGRFEAGSSKTTGNISIEGRKRDDQSKLRELYDCLQAGHPFFLPAIVPPEHINTGFLLMDEQVRFKGYTCFVAFKLALTVIALRTLREHFHDQARMCDMHWS